VDSLNNAPVTYQKNSRQFLMSTYVNMVGGRDTWADDRVNTVYYLRKSAQRTVFASGARTGYQRGRATRQTEPGKYALRRNESNSEGCETGRVHVVVIGLYASDGECYAECFSL